MRFFQEFIKGFWQELAPFRLVLGLCPVLAVTKTMHGGFGMGLATTFVLVNSNVLVSLLRNVIPKKVRIAAFILIIASFVVIVEMMMEAKVYALYGQLGIFIPLIVVNCIILGRAEAFASKNGVLLSFADGMGIGLGFTISLTFLGAIRELFGTGLIEFMWMGEALFKIQPFGEAFNAFGFMQSPPGAFVCLGVLLGLMNLIGKK